MTTHKAEKAQPEHQPLIYSTGRYGCWAQCCCGWSSRTWTTVSGVHGEFGLHLVDVCTPPVVSGDGGERP